MRFGEGYEKRHAYEKKIIILIFLLYMFPIYIFFRASLKNFWGRKIGKLVVRVTNYLNENMCLEKDKIIIYSR